MSIWKNNFIIGSLVLLAFVSVGVFGLVGWSHTTSSTETPMMNCPYAENGFSVCENTLDHISGWQQFSNVTLMSLFALYLFVSGIILYFIGKHNFFNEKQYFESWKYYLDIKILYSPKEEIIKWLSFFENSPSFLYARYS